MKFIKFYSICSVDKWHCMGYNAICDIESNHADKLLLERHIGQKVRKAGGRTKSPAKRCKEDDARFEAAFEVLLSGNQ